ncbi:uncharacterized protein LOC108677105 [Hyalella azteca]|uniref:Uncharacterized protein LOC108677105 n=1 Tax=Hyalella azteca TaxID=294128 RepID=A0A8B7P3Q3_HYAAZ|nr:uncharacterized protein LOC108677105 [Hyalella azteca]
MDFKGGTQHTTRVNLAHTSKRRALGLLIAAALLHMGGAVVQHVTDTFKKTDLAFESHLRERCPPLPIGLVQSWLPYKLQCLSLCNLNISCTFFMSKGDLCELWTVKLDPSYDFAQFNAPTVPVFWNIKSIGTENQDFAIGKPVTAGSVFPGYPDPSVLTQGADCYLVMEDCFCTSASNNWVRVDLLTTAFITEVVVTASVIDDVPYIRAATIRIIRRPIDEYRDIC